jgi:hypothetical protein
MICAGVIVVLLFSATIEPMSLSPSPSPLLCGHQLGHAKTPGAEMIAVIASLHLEVSKTIILARRSAYPWEVIMLKGYENQGGKS